MSNEPNEAERQTALEITTYVCSHPRDWDFTDIASIIAAHRADESELAKALELCADALGTIVSEHGEGEVPEYEEVERIARAALAAYAAAKG